MAIGLVHRIFPSPSPFREGASPINHQRGPPWSLKATKNTIQLSRNDSAFFLGEEESSSPIRALKSCLYDLTLPITPLGKRITHLSPQGPASEPQSDQQYHPDNQVWLSRLSPG